MGQLNKTIQILVTAGISAAAIVIGTGCETSAKPAQTNAGIRGDVTDVRPIEPAAPAAYSPPVYDNSAIVPTAPQAVTVEPVMAMSIAPDVAKKHTVQHGETLFSIAKASYGDGKQWKKIAAANPSVSPSKLKVGQVLAMP